MAKTEQSITRSTETDPVWHKRLYAFIAAAHRSKKGVLIDYLFEPSHTIPQRLYRYDLFDDYLSRHRDDFEFGFDLITRARIITGSPTYSVYVIELDGNKNHVYIGQTWYTPEERLAQHLTGYAVFHAAKPFKAGATGRLRPDLYEHLPRYKTQAQAEAMEAKWARELAAAGYRVEGGH